MAAGLAFIVLTAWVSGGLHSGSEVAFFLVASCATGYCTDVAVALSRRVDPLLAARRVVVLIVVFLTPVAFDMTAWLGWNSPKVAVVAIGAALVAGLWAIQRAGGGSLPSFRNGLHWPVLAFVGWVTLATATSISPVLSLVGHYDFFDGLLFLLGAVVLFFAAAADFGVAEAKSLLSALYLGPGSVVVFYGLLQLHDRLTSWGGRWEWAYPKSAITSNNPFSVATDIWSTLSNPNHLAGFLAILLPVGAALLVTERGWRLRLPIAAVGAGLLAELVQTTSRGALLAATAALLVVGLLSLRRVHLTARQLAIAAACLVALVALAGGLSSSGHTKYHLSDLVSRGNTTRERLEYWKAAIHISASHPILGSGPDTFANELPAIQSAKSASLSGAEAMADGPHNIFLGLAATVGLPGLLLFLTILAAAVRRVVKTVGHHRSLDESARVTDEPRMLVVAMLAASVSAYVIQASFDIQQVTLTMIFWVLLGLLCAATKPVTGAATLPGPHSARQGGRRPSRNRRPASSEQGAQLAVAAFVLGVVILVTITALRPYLAAKALNRGAQAALGAREAGTTNVAAFLSFDRVARNQLQRAVNLDPAEPFFAATYAEYLLLIPRKSGPGAPDPMVDVRHAENLLRRSVDLDPSVSRELGWLALAYGSEYQLDHQPAALNAEITFFRRAVKANPRAPVYPLRVASLLYAQGKSDEAQSVIRTALREIPGDKDLLDAQQRIGQGRPPATPSLPPVQSPLVG